LKNRLTLPDFSIEKKLWKENLVVAGVDEAGRGPIAGPVCAAAVVFKDETKIEGLNDSKQLTEKKREDLFEIINSEVLSVAFDFQDNLIIDKINILQATMNAMMNSIEKLNHKPNHLLIDGNYFSPFFVSYETIVKGDTISASIAAASIIAKVKRDRWMKEIAHNEFPEYNFDKNKGYGTKEHYQAIEKYGICKYHRKTFLTRILK
jgi:ribonuclease HII